MSFTPFFAPPPPHSSSLDHLLSKPSYCSGSAIEGNPNLDMYWTIIVEQVEGEAGESDFTEAKKKKKKGRISRMKQQSIV